MKKKKLRIEELSVDTFEAGAALVAGRGTVRGQSGPPNCFSGIPSCIESCDPNATCGLSCNGSCLATQGLCCPDA
jgi:hypothetical protein